MNRGMIVAGLLIISLVVASVFWGLSLVLQDNDNGNATGTTPTTTIEESNGFISVVDFVESTFDGKGFANESDTNSTLQSTFFAVQLLDLLNLTDEIDLQDEFSAIADVIIADQDQSGYFGAWNDSSTEKLRKTAYSITILQKIGQLDEDTEMRCYKYLATYFLGGLELDDWIPHAVFMNHYWGLMAAKGMDNIFILGLRELTIDGNVFELGDTNYTIGEKLYWNETFYSERDLLWFEGLPMHERLRIIESFEWMMSYRYECPTLINLLVNTTNTIRDVVNWYNYTSGLFDDAPYEPTGYLTPPPVLDPTPLESSRMFRLLISMGGLDEIFNETSRESLLLKISEQVQEIVDIDKNECNPNSTLNDILAMTQTWLDINYGLLWLE
jgi:hypothetical protein